MFFEQLARYGHRIAAIDGQKQLSYQQLSDQCDQLAQHLDLPNKSLIIIKAGNNLATLIGYLTALREHHCVMLVNAEIAETQLTHLIAAYQPQVILSAQDELLPLITLCETSSSHSIAPELAMLLSTSGSTGAAKQVALSYANIQANADSIVEYLPMLASDASLCHLPFFYSYGLSIINSHLNLGACCVLTELTPVNREFWLLFEKHKISSFGGVPYSYEMLLRLRFTSKSFPHLRYFTQAGGKMAVDKILTFAQYARRQQKQFFIMYGQTEASPRMAFLPSSKVALKPNSIGQAIPQGQFCLKDDSGELVTKKGQSAQLFYKGPNVMLGYVNDSSQLAQFSPAEWLATGDIAYTDEQGDYFISGRMSRFIKLFGQRIDLDQVERLLAEMQLEAYCCGSDSRLIIALKHTPKDDNAGASIPDIKMTIAKQLGLHPSTIQMIVYAQLPLTDNGKKDYHAVTLLAKTLRGHAPDTQTPNADLPAGDV